jgi:hypothetical protein
MNRIVASKPMGMLFAALDIMMGYHTICVNKSLEEITTFTMPWVRLPF